MADSSTATPLAHRSISLRLYPHDLEPPAVVSEIAAQSATAEQAGFDGVMTQEHHGGFPNYLPNPLLMATWALGATTRLWAAPCPILLPLRPWTQLVEDVAWTSHRYPGRVGVGIGAGAFPLDFEMAGVPFDELRSRFNEAMPKVAAALSGAAEGPVAADPGVAALAQRPVPLVVAAQGPRTVRRAARLGLGVIYSSLQGRERTRELSSLHEDEGGRGARILIRRVWLGDPPRESVDAQMARYRAVSPADLQEHWHREGGLLTSTDGDELAERIHEEVVGSLCDSVNVRIFQAGMSPAAVRSQLEVLGSDVLPRLRILFSASPSTSGDGGSRS